MISMVNVPMSVDGTKFLLDIIRVISLSNGRYIPVYVLSWTTN